MLVLTFQDKNTIKKIKKNIYVPKLDNSSYAYSSIEFTMGYKKVLNELRKKDEFLPEDESCLWGWVFSPSEEMILMLKGENKVAVYLDVDESKMVFSDYCVYTSFVLGESGDSNFIIKDIGDAMKQDKNIQCSFTPDAINRVIGVYKCDTFLPYPDINKCMYSQMLVSSIESAKLMSQSNISSENSSALYAVC